MPTVGFFQFCPVFGEVERNAAQVVEAVGQVRADLVVLPELPFTGYYFRDRRELEALAEDPDDSPTVDALVRLCRARDLHVVTGFAERRGDRCYNSALVVGPEGIVHVYRKLHLFGTEVDCFDPGDLPLQVVEVGGMRIGTMVCFDWAFPEVARVLALQGADVICQPANLVLTYCQQTMVARSIENRVYTVTANRHGVDARPHGELAFTGQSQVVSPRGAVLYRAAAGADEMCAVEIDLAAARDKRITPQNDLLADRRPRFYSLLSDPQ